MAQPSNTFDSYDAVGIREDLENVIYDISPEETPFYSSSKKVKASNTYHEWQTDALRASTTNAHIEGDATTAEARVATTRLGNYTQIFKNAVVIPDTDKGLDKAGRASEMAYQTLKIAKEQKLDIEKALFANNARVAGDATTARELAGTETWFTSTIQNKGTGGAHAAGTGADARTDGTQTAFTQAKFDAIMQNCWEKGGKPDSVYLSAYLMNLALAFTGNNNQRSTVQPTNQPIGGGGGEVSPQPRPGLPGQGRDRDRGHRPRHVGEPGTDNLRVPSPASSGHLCRRRPGRGRRRRSRRSPERRRPAGHLFFRPLRQLGSPGPDRRPPGSADPPDLPGAQQSARRAAVPSPAAGRLRVAAEGIRGGAPSPKIAARRRAPGNVGGSEDERWHRGPLFRPRRHDGAGGGAIRVALRLPGGPGPHRTPGGLPLSGHPSRPDHPGRRG